MIFGKPKHFYMPKEYLVRCRADIVLYLELKDQNVDYYIEAYDYFLDHPTEYDGATIVKDLIDVYIDLPAMRHDYDYVVNLKKYKGLKWIVKKLTYDFDYGKNIEKMGKGIWTPYMRSFGLWLSTPLYWLGQKLKAF